MILSFIKKGFLLKNYLLYFILNWFVKKITSYLRKIVKICYMVNFEIVLYKLNYYFYTEKKGKIVSLLIYY